MQILKSCGLTLAEDIKNFKLDLHFARKTTHLVYIFFFLLLHILFLQVTLEKATSARCKLLQTTEQYL